MWCYLILSLISAIVIYSFIIYPVEKIKYYTHQITYVIIASVGSVILLPLFLLRPKDTRNAQHFNWLVDIYNWIYGIRCYIRNPEHVAEDKGAVVVCNHQSFFDTSVLSLVARSANKFATTAKTEIKYFGSFGLTAILCGTVFITRNSKTGIADIKDAVNVIIKDKVKLVVFPEGTRNNKFPALLDFKKGAFNLAVETQVPVIPAVISPLYFINKKNKTFKNGTLVMQLLEPISTEGLTREDVPELTTRVHDIMQDAFIRLSKEVLDQLPPDFQHEYHFNE